MDGVKQRLTETHCIEHTAEWLQHTDNNYNNNYYYKYYFYGDGRCQTETHRNTLHRAHSRATTTYRQQQQQLLLPLPLPLPLRWWTLDTGNKLSLCYTHHASMASMTPHLYLPGDFFAAICNYMFWLGIQPLKLPFLWGPGTPPNIMCHNESHCTC